jgi:hypothetical protein
MSSHLLFRSGHQPNNFKKITYKPQIKTAYNSYSLQSQRWTLGWTEPLYFRHYGISINKLEDFKRIWSPFFGVIICLFYRVLLHFWTYVPLPTLFLWNWFLAIAKERWRSSLIKHQKVCKFRFTTLALSNLDPAAFITGCTLVFCCKSFSFDVSKYC